MSSREAFDFDSRLVIPRGLLSDALVLRIGLLLTGTIPDDARNAMVV